MEIRDMYQFAWIKVSRNGANILDTTPRMAGPHKITQTEKKILTINRRYSCQVMCTNMRLIDFVEVNVHHLS